MTANRTQQAFLSDVLQATSQDVVKWPTWNPNNERFQLNKQCRHQWRHRATSVAHSHAKKNHRTPQTISFVNPPFLRCLSDCLSWSRIRPVDGSHRTERVVVISRGIDTDSVLTDATPGNKYQTFAERLCRLLATDLMQDVRLAVEERIRNTLTYLRPCDWLNYATLSFDFLFFFVNVDKSLGNSILMT